VSKSKRSKLQKKPKTDDRGDILVDHSGLWAISDPHCRRYYHACQSFLKELVRLMVRWQIFSYQDRTYISLPPDLDKGVFMVKPKKAKKR
jgi:hypothetical protein